MSLIESPIATSTTGSNYPAVIDWTYASQPTPLALVARLAGAPIAVIELRPGEGFQLTACTGENLGLHQNVDDAIAACENHFAVTRAR